MMKNIKSLFIWQKRNKIFSLRERITYFPYFLLFCFFAFVPLLTTLVYHYNAVYSLTTLQEKLSDLQVRYCRAKVEEKKRLEHSKNFSRADPYFLDKEVEPLQFLLRETEYLETIVKYQTFKNCKSLAERLVFLQKQNHLQFTEKERKQFPLFEEVFLGQISPIELDMQDLKQVLARLEGVKIDNDCKEFPSRPQIFIKNFDLYKRKKSTSEVFCLDLELIQREMK